jgi:hypothetical protein
MTSITCWMSPLNYGSFLDAKQIVQKSELRTIKKATIWMVKLLLLNTFKNQEKHI